MTIDSLTGALLELPFAVKPRFDARPHTYFIFDLHLHDAGSCTWIKSTLRFPKTSETEVVDFGDLTFGKGANVEIEVTGENANEAATDLQRWLQESRLRGATYERLRRPLPAGAMGGEFLPVITAVLAAPITLEIFKAVVAWYAAKQPKVKITVKLNDQTTVEIQGGRDEALRTLQDVTKKIGMQSSQ